MRTRVAGVVTALMALTCLQVTARADAAVPAYHPSRLTHLGDARQVIVVTSSTRASTYATVRAYRKTSTGWVEQFAPMTARLGYGGFAKLGARRQGTGTTPSGTFALLRAFGSAPEPVTAMSYRRFDRNDWWPYDPRDPATYNAAQLHGRSDATRWRTSWAERLWHFRDQYRYAVVLDYNLPSGIQRVGAQRLAMTTADTLAGGGIFLHVSAPHPTSGCVSVDRPQMRAILEWLDPARAPVIVMAPITRIGRA